jgi:hypothetical protein
VRLVNRQRSAVLALIVIAVFLQPIWSPAGAQELETLFQQAQTDPSQRPAFVTMYTKQRGLPEHVYKIAYSDRLSALALTNPLRQDRAGDFELITNTRGIGKGYPSIITVGPKMFATAYNFADFESVFQHEATHARYWATGQLLYMDKLDTDEARLVKGVLRILFELDAIKAQTEHPSWRQTSPGFRKGQEAYKQHWMDQLDKLRKKMAPTVAGALLDRIWNNYR